MVTNLTKIIYTHIEAVKDVIGQLKEQRTVKKKQEQYTKLRKFDNFDMDHLQRIIHGMHRRREYVS